MSHMQLPRPKHDWDATSFIMMTVIHIASFQKHSVINSLIININMQYDQDSHSTEPRYVRPLDLSEIWVKFGKFRTFRKIWWKFQHSHSIPQFRVKSSQLTTPRISGKILSFHF